MNQTITRITARGLIGRRRFLLLLPLPLLLVGLAVLSTWFSDSSAESADRALRVGIVTVMIGFGMAVVVPLTALIVGTGVLSPEIDDGTLLHVLAKPLPRRQILLSKLLVAGVVSVVVTAPAMFLAGWLVDDLALGVGFACGGAIASVVYCAVFVALSLVTRRPVLVGLVYVLVWEGLLCHQVAGTAVLSIQQYGLAVADQLSGSTVFAGQVSVPVSIVMSVVFLVCATWLAVDRLRSFSVSGTVG